MQYAFNVRNLNALEVLYVVMNSCNDQTAGDVTPKP
jgi:hypothetical protein